MYTINVNITEELFIYVYIFFFIEYFNMETLETSIELGYIHKSCPIISILNTLCVVFSPADEKQKFVHKCQK